MKKINVAGLRAKLTAKELLPLPEAIEIRTRLSAHAEATYKAKNTPAKTLAFIEDNSDCFQIKRTNPQDQQVPYVYQLFTKRSSWVAGDTVQECLDRAMTVKKDWTKVSDRDAAALIMAHQALQDANEDRVAVKEVA